MFGDGSSGPLNVTSGTHNLPLNTKHQFTTVNVAAGATLSTNSSTGAVLYILARESITIDGKIDVSNKVNRGNNSWSVTIDGVSYSSPGVRNGAWYANAGQSGTGHGAGGYGGGVQGTTGGLASTGGESPAGGTGPWISRTTNGTTATPGGAGSQSGGGGGAAWVTFDNGGVSQLQGQVVAHAGAGASTWGEDGQNGAVSFTNLNPSAGNPGYGAVAAGGGGGGGVAGRAGVHVVLKAPTVVINGEVIMAGTNGGNGGNGGRTRNLAGWTNFWGGAGLGGGGGNGGTFSTVYSQSFLLNANFNRSGGQGGLNGLGGEGFTRPSSNNGQNGLAGGSSVTRLTNPADWATDLSATSIESAEAFGTHAFIPDPLNLTAGSITSGEAHATDHVITMHLEATSVGSTLSLSNDGVITLSPPPPLPPVDWEAIGKEDDKTYVYRVYSSTGAFIGIWTDVGDDPEFTQAINTPGTTMTTKLNRSPNTTKEVRAALVTQAGDVLQTQDNYEFAVTYETNNSVGPGTDVDINHNVDVYVQYGEFSNLITQGGDFLVTESGDQLMVASGSPSGKRIFSGYILDYELRYGAQSSVWVTLASNGVELSQSLIRDGETIRVNYPSQELATTARSILDTNPGKMTHSTASIVTTGVSASFNFQLNTKLEGIVSVYGQTPEGFYWYGDVATNEIVMKPRSTTPDHVLKLGYHMKSINLKRSQEQLRNLVYFVGAENETTGISLLKKYQDAASQAAWRVGLFRLTDRRYSVPENMQRRAEKEMANYKGPIYTTEVTISSARYDIETIQLGQMVAFANTDGPLREVMLQVVNRTYKPREVTIQLGGLLDTQHGIVNDIEDALANEQYQRLPNAPT